MANPTAAKLAEQIKAIAARMLQRRIEDPRLGFLTITDVRLSRDWRRCELFYTVWGEAEAWAQTAAGLEAAKGQIRTQVARSLKLRFTPEIVFQPDAVPQLSSQLEAALEAARQADARVADLALGAEYAGDPDPYKAGPEDDHDGDDRDGRDAWADRDGRAGDGWADWGDRGTDGRDAREDRAAGWSDGAAGRPGDRDDWSDDGPNGWGDPAADGADGRSDDQDDGRNVPPADAAPEPGSGPTAAGDGAGDGG